MKITAIGGKKVVAISLALRLLCAVMTEVVHVYRVAETHLLEVVCMSAAQILYFIFIKKKVGSGRKLFKNLTPILYFDPTFVEIQKSLLPTNPFPVGNQPNRVRCRSKVGYQGI